MAKRNPKGPEKSPAPNDPTRPPTMTMKVKSGGRHVQSAGADHDQATPADQEAPDVETDKP